ncbi:hypothetical protein BH24CHL9_BH24CHL9_13980 [soil metagenome]
MRPSDHEPNDHDMMVERLRQTFDLFDAGVSMMRARLRREHPTLDEQGIERLLGAWLASRPGAEHGDSAGVPRRQVDIRE